MKIKDLLRNAFRDADAERDLSSNSFHNSSSSKWGRDIDDSGIGSGCLLSLKMVSTATVEYSERTSDTLAKTGRLRCNDPAFAGETPPTMFVPYSMAFCVWKVPFVG